MRFVFVRMREAERVAVRLAYRYDRRSWLCGRVYGYLGVRRGIDFVSAGHDGMHIYQQALRVLDGEIGQRGELFLSRLLARAAQVRRGRELGWRERRRQAISVYEGFGLWLAWREPLMFRQ